MIQIKDNKEKYRNPIAKRKAAFRRRSFSMNSKIYEKPMNLTKQIIHGRKKFSAVFIERVKILVMKSGRRRI